MQQPVDILLVDDRPENLLALEAILESPELRLVKASSGNEALGLMLDYDIAVVLLDVQMPGMDGFETARLMRGSARTRHTPIIFVTAISKEQKYVFEGYESGAVDYLFKPLEPEVVCSKVKVFAELHRQRRALEQKTQELNEANSALQEAYQQIKKDLQVAASVQRSLLPTEVAESDTVNISWEFLPCEELGGDILNVLQMDADHLACYVLDVSGHGVTASLLSCALSMVLSPGKGPGSVLWTQEQDQQVRLAGPAEVASRLNARFPMKDDTCQFFTIFYGLLNTRTREFRYVCAGHPPPILVDRGGQTRLLSLRSPAIGFLGEMARYEEDQIVLQPGDRLCVYSDGLMEARNQEGALFNTERLDAQWAQARTLPLPAALQSVFEAVADWREGPPDDDLSLLAVEIT